MFSRKHISKQTSSKKNCASPNAAKKLATSLYQSYHLKSGKNTVNKLL